MKLAKERNFHYFLEKIFSCDLSLNPANLCFQHIFNVKLSELIKKCLFSIEFLEENFKTEEFRENFNGKTEEFWKRSILDTEEFEFSAMRSKSYLILRSCFFSLKDLRLPEGRYFTGHLDTEDWSMVSMVKDLGF